MTRPTLKQIDDPTHQCEAEVPDGGRSVTFHQCLFQSKVKRKDKWYCGKHDPMVLEAKGKAQHDKWEKEYNIREQQRVVQNHWNRIAQCGIEQIKNPSFQSMIDLSKAVSDHELTIVHLEALKE